MYLILFFCVPLLLALVLIKLTEKKTQRKHARLLQSIIEGSESAVPETAGMLKTVKFGSMGKVAFYFKDSSLFFAMTVTDFAIPLATQPAEHKNFKPYIKEFARRVNGNEQESDV